MSEQKIIKRFIAGAVCPRCAEMDKLVMYDNGDGQQVRECVSCGYSDIMTDEGPQAIDADEVVTRVNQPRPGEAPLAHEDEVQVVSIIDPNPGAKRRDH
ncbi:YheV family putative zinc ribbon protein [uncultured Oceanicoccus sp.]|uniref:YheV family putative zinc ribbon protein n=1 Tax=uncultured Oceanicoccus sp. TaxID=1706381 RepID=UPI0030D81D49